MSVPGALNCTTKLANNMAPLYYLRYKTSLGIVDGSVNTSEESRRSLSRDGPVALVTERLGYFNIVWRSGMSASLQLKNGAWSHA